MKASVKILSRASFVVICAATLTVGRSERVSGDTTSSPDPNDPNYHDPSEPYVPGPRALFYDQASTALKADVEEVLQKEDLSQPPSSYQAFAAAAAAVNADAKLQTEARAIGLLDSADQGVVP